MAEASYAALLGRAWSDLPEPLQTAHSAPLKASGRVNVRYGRWGRLFSRLVRFPSEGRGQRVRIEVVESGGGLLWQRWFEEEEWSSFQSFTENRMVESIGAFRIAFEVIWAERTLTYATKRFSLFGVPLPWPLAPLVTGEVSPEGEGWRVHVTTVAPIFGLIWEYEACLTPE